MLKVSQLPDFTFVQDGRDELLSLSRCGGQIEWLCERILQMFPLETRLGIIQPTGPALILLWLAALKAGKEPCILQYPTEKISKQYWRDSVQHTIESAGLEGLVHSASIEPHRPNELARCLLLDDVFGESTLKGDEISQGAIIQLSSGTTGYKKGIRLTLDQLSRHVENYNQVMQLGPDDKIVSWLPLYHDMGFVACFVMPLMLQVPVIMLDPIAWVKRPESLFSAIRKHAGTICYMPNFGFELMSRITEASGLGSIRKWISCSEPTYFQTLDRFCQRTGVRPETVCTCYGMAENVFAVTQSQGLKTFADTGSPAVSCGKPIPNTQVKLVDGEIFVKSDTSLTAYVGSEDMRDAEGYYGTGDVGKIVEGEVVICGRKRDVMFSAGKKYFLSDLDYALGQILPESAGRIAALAEYCQKLGTERVIFLIERSCFWERGDLDSIAAQVKAQTNLEAFQVHFVPPSFITKTSSGKINRKKTLEDWRAHQERTARQAGEAPAHADAPERFLKQVRSSFSSLSLDQPLSNALDSLGAVVMRLICEDYGLEYQPERCVHELASSLSHPVPKAQQQVFSIVALVDGIKLGFGGKSSFITEKFISALAAEVGMPVRIEHLCVPPAPILLSDIIFHDFFMPRDWDEKYKPFSSVIQKIKSASMILIDDEDSFRLADFCVYPRLSHRFENHADADLLGHRLATYTKQHHLLAREVVPGKDLRPEDVTQSIERLASYLDRPVMKLAFHEQFNKYTQTWDYQEYRSYKSDADYAQNPVKADALQKAILEFIRRYRGQMRGTSGVPASKAVLKDPPHFCSFLINRDAVDFVLNEYGSFCIGGLPSSVPYIEKELKRLGKPFVYETSVDPLRSDFDCLLFTGFSGATRTTKPHFDFLQLGDEGGKPHNVSPELERRCPSLVAGDHSLIEEYRASHSNLVPIGNYILNCEARLRGTVSHAPRSQAIAGTVVIYGPIYSRSGFGLLTRGWALALQHAGLNVRIVPVDCGDPSTCGDLDDCDLYQLRKLEQTPLLAPVTAIFSYVPTYVWPKLPLPEPHVRIMLTTFDSSAKAMNPPYRLIHICNQMDQIWVANRSEEEAWIRAGAKPELLRSFRWPNDWIDNPVLAPARPKVSKPGEPFRFLHVSVFFPRRRLDVLIKAFFEEFRQANSAELYLKISYPSWHPVAGQPKRDLQALIERLRCQTGSKARVILDESLGTRKQLAELFDSCDFYVSADTSSTAPVSEALFRSRLGIITDGWNVELPEEMIVVKNSTRLVQMTPEMAAYMPHHKGGSFPALEVKDMRVALRQAWAMPPEQRAAKALRALAFMRERFSYAATAPAAVQAIQEAWQRKQKTPSISAAPAAPKTSPAAVVPTDRSRNIVWCGLQLFYGKVPSINRGLALELARRGHQLSLRPSNGPYQIEELPLESRGEYMELAERFYAPLRQKPEVTVSSRWHPIFQEEMAARQVMVNTWWSGAIPQEWVQRIDQYVDEVWVPSRHVRDNFVLGGVPEGKVWVMPMGVDSELFWPEASAQPLKTKKTFRFLFVGETSARKGIDLLLQAYGSAFSAKDDVCLVIKDVSCEDYYWRKASAEVIRAHQANPRFPEIEYLDGMIAEKDLPGLYAACDCFVQPFRTASFPLAALEAMACARPVITTGYGGALDLCDENTGYVIPAREIKTRRDFVGHWRVTGPQRHAELNIADLRERMIHVVNHCGEAEARGRSARKAVCERFDWKKQVAAVETRLARIVEQPEVKASMSSTISAPAAPPAKMTEALPWLGLKQFTGSVLFFAPFYNRSGYGTGARAIVAGLQAAGISVRIVPVDNVEPGIDDCDMAMLKALEQTPLQLPLAAVFFHVPHPNWLKIPLPDQSIRVLYTTFDSSAQGNKPPADWIEVCRQMDQVWLMTQQEADVFASAGVPSNKIHVIPCPHPWISNSSLPLPSVSTGTPTTFRFLSLAMFLPRRRWDTLIEAFLSEFREGEAVELYLKVNYPSWHPIAGKPQRDLQQLIQRLREKTGSIASIVIDEELGTRRDVCRLMDSCHAYVSTDTASTAPLSEALVRSRMAIVPAGYGATLPYCESMLIIPTDPALKTAITPDMLQYQPHHRGKDMPLLRVDDVRATLRSAYELPAERQAEMGRFASLFMETNFGPGVVTPRIVHAVQSGFAQKLQAPPPRAGEAAKSLSKPPISSAPTSVYWEGSFLDLGSLSLVNRQLTKELARHSGVQLTCGSNRGTAPVAATHPDFDALSKTLQSQPPKGVQITVRHAWPPDWRRPASGKLVVIQPWEFGALPISWVEQARHVDEFWVPSKHVAEVYIQSGVPAEKVQVVPNGVDADQFTPEVTPMKLATKKSFKFLFVGGTILRKGPDVLLDSYLKSFDANDDVCLVIKDFGGQTFYAGQTIAARIQAARSKPGAPEILYLTEEYPPEALPSLYAACDCLVHPYRGEGFGLPILEAMAGGLPVIVTAGGAADDFTNPEVAYHVPASRRPIGNTVSGMELAGPGWLLEPDGHALAARMKWVVEHRQESRELGRRASDYARNQWTWANSARIAAGRLDVLQADLKNRTKSSRASVARSLPSVRPQCALLGQLEKARELLLNKKPREAWELTNEAIKVRPYHPEAFLLLAQIAESAGDGQNGRLCAEHARRLAPDWKAARQFLNRRLKGNSRPDWLIVPEMAKQASKRLSVCLITRNEARFIERCLQSVKSIASQLIVVDTGSTDATVEIAKSLGAEVYHFAWCDDFSAARNAALEHARGDWVLVLDADEELTPDQHARLKADLSDSKNIGFRLPLVNQGREAEGRSCVPRLFRNAPGVYYYGRIHEQVFPSLLGLSKAWGLGTGLGTAQILHHGYTEETVKDRNKVERNLKLLRLAVDEDPDDSNLAMNLGLELVRSGDLEGGLAEYRRAFEIMASKPVAETGPEVREALLTQFTCHLYKVRAHQEVVETLSSPAARASGLTASHHFALGLACFELGRHSEAAEQMRQCVAKRDQPALTPLNTDILTAAPFHCLAMSLAKAGDLAGAEKSFENGMKEKGHEEELRLDFARFLFERDRPLDALHKLHDLVAVTPGSVAAWQLGGQIALSRADFLEFACDWTAEAAKHLPEVNSIIAQRAEALLLSQQAAQARPLWQWLCQTDAVPRARAALILCELVEASPLDLGTDVSEADLGPVSRAFIEWYQLCLKMRANGIIHQLNARVESLRPILPAAASLIEGALAEARTETVPVAEPCLA